MITLTYLIIKCIDPELNIPRIYLSVLWKPDSLLCSLGCLQLSHFQMVTDHEISSSDMRRPRSLQFLYDFIRRRETHGQVSPPGFSTEEVLPSNSPCVS